MKPSTTGRTFVVAIMSAGALLASGCGIGWADQPIGRVRVSEDGRSLTVGWHCHHDADVEVEESDDEVRLRLRVDGYRGDCADGEQVTLSSALGDRRIVDSTTGTILTPCPAPADGAPGTPGDPDCR